jgi:hypothetical protein
MLSKWPSFVSVDGNLYQLLIDPFLIGSADAAGQQQRSGSTEGL